MARSSAPCLREATLEHRRFLPGMIAQGIIVGCWRYATRATHPAATTPCSYATSSMEAIMRLGCFTRACLRLSQSPMAAPGRQRQQRRARIWGSRIRLLRWTRVINGSMARRSIKKCSPLALRAQMISRWQRESRVYTRLLDMHGMLYGSANYNGYAFVIPAPKTQNVNYQIGLEYNKATNAVIIATTSRTYVSGFCGHQIHQDMTSGGRPTRRPFAI